MIDIKDIIPFMRNGWVAMDSDNKWFWYSNKPLNPKGVIAIWHKNGGDVGDLYASFDISPAEDWTKSLIKVENK